MSKLTVVVRKHSDSENHGVWTQIDGGPREIVATHESLESALRHAEGLALGEGEAYHVLPDHTILTVAESLARLAKPKSIKACDLDADFVSLYQDDPRPTEPWMVCLEHVERSGWSELIKAYPHDRRDAALAHAQHEAKRRTMALYHVGFDSSLTPIPMGPGVVLIEPLEAADDATQIVWQLSICRGRDVHTLGEWASLADAVVEAEFAADECGMPMFAIDPADGLWVAPAALLAPAVA